jgi:molybdopterin-guanine dinucleotide biosynthesis adapter protein
MSSIPVIQVVGYKNSGKTTVTCKMIRGLSNKGWKVGSIKHDAHDFEVDYPGKDTWQHREAGAIVTAINSRDKTAIMEQRGTTLQALIERIHGVDVVMVEGYKFESYPKIVILKQERDISLLSETSGIIAIASWFTLQHETIPVVRHDDYEAMLEIVIRAVEVKGEEV